MVSCLYSSLVSTVVSQIFQDLELYKDHPRFCPSSCRTASTPLPSVIRDILELPHPLQIAARRRKPQANRQYTISKGHSLVASSVQDNASNIEGVPTTAYSISLSTGCNQPHRQRSLDQLPRIQDNSLQDHVSRTRPHQQLHIRSQEKSLVA